MLSELEFKEALPSKFKKSVNQELIDRVNQAMSDPEFYEQYRENLMSYTKVLQEGKFRISQYLDAVKYVSYKLMGNTNKQAYSQTFPDKIAKFQANQVADKDVASYITAYNKSKLVNLILEQTLVPTWVLNQDMYQKALNVQAELMLTANSEKVRSDAANSLLTHLKQPETQKVELNVGVQETDTIKELRNATMELVKQQRLQIESGTVDAQSVASSKLILDGDYEEIEK